MSATPPEPPATALWPLVRQLWRGRVASLSAAGLLINLGMLVMPLFAMLVYDKVVHNGIFETLWALSLGVVLWLGIELVLRSMRARQVERLAVALDEQVDERLFAQLIQPTGRGGAQPGMAARFLTLYRDLNGARDFFSSTYLLALADLPFVLLTWLVIGLIAWPLLVVLAVWTAVYVGLGLMLKGKAQAKARQLAKLQTHKLALLTDALSSLDALRTSESGAHYAARFKAAASAHSAESSALRLEQVAHSHLTQAIYLLSYVSLLAAGAYLVFGQVITTGALIAVSMLSGRTLGAVGMALITAGRWDELKQSLQALAPYVSEQPERTDTLRRPADVVQGRLDVVAAAHQYTSTPGAPPVDVLRELSLSFAPGERVGLLGRPGSGKTTLLRILAGAMCPTRGEVRVDHLGLLATHAGDRGQWLGFKSQDSVLLAGTVESNILLNLPASATPQARQQALDHALFFSTLDGDLAANRLSLSQPVEEYGANLSGGQRQKLALARTLATHPRILLLDEPSNGLDPESEKALAERLGQLKGVTLVMATHSATMLSLTERIVALDNGRLIADGPTHKLVMGMAAGPAGDATPPKTAAKAATATTAARAVT